MNEAEAFAVGSKAVEEALNRSGNHKVSALQDLNNQAQTDGRLKEALKTVGLLELQSEQAVKH